jgi:3-oxoacyl-[acyl-carrier-protein] synthase II
MKGDLSVQGIGLVGGFGQGRAALLAACEGDPRANAQVPVLTPTGEQQLPLYQADVTPVREFVRGGALRRMNRYARMGVLGASLALVDAAYEAQGRNDLGLVVASGYGASKSTFDFLDTMIDDGGRCPSPTQFSNSVHSSAASHISIVLQVGGPCLTVSQFEMSPISALLTARQWLLEERVNAVLFGAVDEYCPVLGYCYERFYGASAQGPLQPEQWSRQTAVMGEGAVFLLLERARDEARYGCIESLDWCQAGAVNVDPGQGLVLGADGQVCTARRYRDWAARHPDPRIYSPVYGSLPGGQAFDIACAALMAQAGRGATRIQSIKCDARDQCGVVTCRFS